MKKNFYILAFIIFGALLQFIIHAVVEIWYIGLLLENFPRYNLGFSWDQWFWIHHIATVFLFVAGVLFGFWQGKFWWKNLYVR